MEVEFVCGADDWVADRLHVWEQSRRPWWDHRSPIRSFIRVELGRYGGKGLPRARKGDPPQAQWRRRGRMPLPWKSCAGQLFSPHSLFFLDKVNYQKYKAPHAEILEVGSSGEWASVSPPDLGNTPHRREDVVRVLRVAWDAQLSATLPVSAPLGFCPGRSAPFPNCVCRDLPRPIHPPPKRR
jgi:hypothetical protein